jgi:signal transduction histidine kinase
MIELREALIASEQKRTLMAAAGAAAHEINQPLTVILGMVDLWMAQMPDDEAVRERLNPIQTAAERIRDIVKQMLKIEQFTTKPYVGDSVIVDFEASSSESSEADRDV